MKRSSRLRTREVIRVPLRRARRNNRRLENVVASCSAPFVDEHRILRRENDEIAAPNRTKSKSDMATDAFLKNICESDIQEQYTVTSPCVGDLRGNASPRHGDSIANYPRRAVNDVQVGRISVGYPSARLRCGYAAACARYNTY